VLLDRGSAFRRGKVFDRDVFRGEHAPACLDYLRRRAFDRTITRFDTHRNRGVGLSGSRGSNDRRGGVDSASEAFDKIFLNSPLHSSHPWGIIRSSKSFGERFEVLLNISTVLRRVNCEGIGRLVAESGAFGLCERVAASNDSRLDRRAILAGVGVFLKKMAATPN
jgi:hypothetical protein